MYELKSPGFDRPTLDHLAKREHDVPAIKDGQGQHIENCQVDVEKDHEEEQAPPAVFRAQKVIHHPADANWPREMLNAHIRPGGGYCDQRLFHHFVNLLDLLPGAGIEERRI